MHQAYLLLGSNLDKERMLPAAVHLLRAQASVHALSSIYESAAVGATGQPDYHNAALLLEVELDPAVLKWQVLRPLEQALGRLRSTDRFAARTMDVDLILYDRLVIELDGSPIPDPDLLVQPHMALPLAEIAPDYQHPITGETLAEIARRLSDGNRIVRRLDWPNRI